MELGEVRAKVAALRRHQVEVLDDLASVDWQSSGYPTLVSFLQDVLRVAPADAKRLVAVMELVVASTAMSGEPVPPRLPIARAAMDEGAITTQHVEKIAKAIEQVPAEHADAVEAEMTELARKFNPKQLGDLGNRIVANLDSDGPEPVDPTVTESPNSLDLHNRPDGSMTGHFDLGAESAAKLRALLSPLAKPQSGDKRILTERQGDALAEIIGMAADSGKVPMQGGERPHFTVTVSLETLQTRIGHANLEDGQTFTPEQARRFACDSNIIPVVLNSKSQPLDIGESKRIADKRLRQALALRDKGCAHPGCERTPHQCHAHHVQHWADGGKTILENMVLLCPFHHRLIHHTGWEVRMVNGLPDFTPPAWLTAAV